MKRLAALAAALLFVSACGGPISSVLPSLSVEHPIASAPTEEPTAEETATPTRTAKPTGTPQEATEEPTEEATEEATPTEQATEQPTEEATGEPTPNETEAASESPSELPASGMITVLAGGGTQSVAAGVMGADAALQRPTGVAVGQSSGDIFIVDSNLGLEVTLDTTGAIAMVVAGLLGPQGVGAEFDESTNTDFPWVADTANARVATPNGHGGWTTIAGSSVGIVGFKGDGQPAKRSLLSSPFDVAGTYIADTTNQRIRYIDPASGNISTIAGNGTEAFSGDGGAAKDAELSNPQAIALNADGTKLYIADYGNFRIREVDLTTGLISTVAGTKDGTAVPFDPTLTGVKTPVQRATAVAVDAQGNAYFPVFWSDLGTTIMRLAPDGTMTLVAGGGKSDTADVNATDFVLPDVLGLAIDAHDGSLLICGSDGRVYHVAGVTTPAG